MVGVDLADISISARNIEVYPESKYPDASSKPLPGQKLNKEALVILCGGIKPKNGLSVADYETKLKKNLEKNGAEHLYYEADTFTWGFKVPLF